MSTESKIYIFCDNFFSLRICDRVSKMNISYTLIFAINLFEKLVNNCSWIKRLMILYAKNADKVYVQDMDTFQLLNKQHVSSELLNTEYKNVLLNNMYEYTSINNAEVINLNDSIINSDLYEALNKYDISINDVILFAYGGQGFIYKGFSRLLSLDVVIKMPNTNDIELSRKNILKEERLFKQAQSKNLDGLPTVYSSNTTGKYMVKEFINGIPMDIIIKNNIYFPLEDFLDFAAKIFNFFHNDLGYIIEDFKAQNIVQDINKKWFLIDIGSVKSNYNSHNISLLEQPIVGSRMYLHCPPELLLKEYTKCSIKIDYFSLGVLCYLVIVGEFPYSNSESNLNKVYQQYYTEYKDAIRKLKKYSENYNYLIIDFIISCLNPNCDDRTSEMINTNYNKFLLNI